MADNTQAARRARRLDAEYKLQRAVGLARAGHSWDDVAEGAGYASGNAALKAVTRYLERRRDETAELGEHVRELELARLDELQRGVWEAAKQGDPKSVRAALSVHDRRVRLHPGLAAVMGPEVSGKDAAELAARADRDLASTLLDIMLSVADRLEYTPAQRVQAPRVLLSELERRGLVPPGEANAGERLVIEGVVEA